MKFWRKDPKKEFLTELSVKGIVLWITLCTVLYLIYYIN